MLFSIIMPVYNAAAFIDRAVQSVVNQSFQDWELILIDDGSTDGSAYMVDSWAARDERIHGLHQPNGGASKARNTGMAHSAGEYLYFLDADDYFGDGLLEEIAQKIESTQADMVLVNARRFLGNGSVQGPQVQIIGSMGETAFRKLLLCGYVREPFTRACKRKKLTGMKFREDLKVSEDLAYTADIMSEITTVTCTEHHFYYYNKTNEHSLTKTKTDLQDNICKYVTWRHFLDTARKCGWNSIDGRLGPYYRYRCRYYGLYLAGHPDEIDRSNPIHQDILSFLQEQDISLHMSDREYTYERLRYAYEAERLGWEICDISIDAWELGAVRAFINFYCANLVYRQLDIRKEAEEFIRFIKKRHSAGGISMKQGLRLKMIEWEMNGFLRLKGRKLLQQLGK